MIGLIIIIAVIGLAVLIFKGLSQSENTSANDVRASQPGHYHDSSCDAEDDKCDDDEYCPELRTYIAGVNYRCGPKDIGGFIGKAIPENNNPHDRNAVAVYRYDGKHLGYLPKDDAKTFRKWYRSKSAPCVGYITHGADNMLRGRVKALDPENPEYAEADIKSYIRWMINNLGPEYCPPEFNISDFK